MPTFQEAGICSSLSVDCLQHQWPHVATQVKLTHAGMTRKLAVILHGTNFSSAKKLHQPAISLICREFNLSGPHPKMSKQAMLERRQQQQDDALTSRPSASGPRARSQSAGRGRPSGEQRIEQLARPKTAHWDKCEYVCPLTPACSLFTAWPYWRVWRPPCGSDVCTQSASKWWQC